MSTPVKVVFGAGSAMSGMVVEASRTRDPPMIVVQPVRPVSVAVHVLLTVVAVKMSPKARTFSREAVLVEDPPGPVVPWVFTLAGPVRM